MRGSFLEARTSTTHTLNSSQQRGSVVFSFAWANVKPITLLVGRIYTPGIYDKT